MCPEVHCLLPSQTADLLAKVAHVWGDSAQMVARTLLIEAIHREHDRFTKLHAYRAGAPDAPVDASGS